VAKNENKTVANDMDVAEYLASVDDERRRSEAEAVIEMMRRVTGEEPQMWGSSLIGFGSYHYRYDSGREGDFFMTGLSPRKAALTVYIMPGFSEYGDDLERLGPHKLGRSCLYIRRLDKVDPDALEALVAKSYAFMQEKYHSD